jgi:hypothetical protein
LKSSAEKERKWIAGHVLARFLCDCNNVQIFPVESLRWPGLVKMLSVRGGVERRWGDDGGAAEVLVVFLGRNARADRQAAGSEARPRWMMGRLPAVGRGCGG